MIFMVILYFADLATYATTNGTKKHESQSRAELPVRSFRGVRAIRGINDSISPTKPRSFSESGIFFGFGL
ncbi:MAG: hypothetical protein WAN16_03235 [Chthoniobacterales bacterium]